MDSLKFDGNLPEASDILTMLVMVDASYGWFIRINDATEITCSLAPP